MTLLSRSSLLWPLVGVCCLWFAQTGFGGSNPQAIQAFAGANNSFALELYAKLKEQEGNLFCSPYSISSALAMLYVGARGDTKTQMQSVLHFDPDQESLGQHFKTMTSALLSKKRKSDMEFSVANAVWVRKDKPILKEYLKVVKQNWGAAAQSVDFRSAPEKSRKTINAWVEKQTRGLFKELLGPSTIDNMTRVVLTNAVYFKAAWQESFNKADTKEAPFKLLSGEKTPVAMMNQMASFPYMETGEFQALELPYRGSELSMIVLLPKKLDGLPELEKSFTRENLGGWLEKLKTQQVAVTLPKFQLSHKIALPEVLKSMGLTGVFSAPPADFSGIDGTKDLFPTAVVHEAAVDVSEKGTEAAAATGVVVGPTSISRPIEFRADHPFIFFIRDNATKTIVFLGRLVSPEK